MPANIPDWTPGGVMPPVGHLDPTSTDRSPYRVGLVDFVLRFATSSERREIVAGLLDYRAALQAVGLRTGMQWLDGSFLENVELLRSRPPGDIDVVTFYNLPPGETQADVLGRDPQLFDNTQVKARFHVDAFNQDLGADGSVLVWWSAYWYGVWSHQRDSLLWKGFVEIDLDGGLDDEARETLASLSSGGGTS